MDTDSEGEEVVQESREAEDLRLLSELREEITSEEMDKKRKKKKVSGCAAAGFSVLLQHRYRKQSKRLRSYNDVPSA